MAIFKKKHTDVQEPADLESVMKKYDQESNVRIWTGTPKIVVDCILAVFSLFCIYVTLFTTWLEELRLTTFVAFIILLGFLVFPARKHHQRPNYIPWYDIVLMVLGVGAFLYYAIFAVDIIQQGSKFETYQIIIGIVGIIALAEVCRRSVGLPILIRCLHSLCPHLGSCQSHLLGQGQLQHPLPVLQQGRHSLHAHQRLLQVHRGVHHLRCISGAHGHCRFLH